MSRKFKTKFSSLTSNLDSIFKDLDIEELDRRRTAAKHATKVMRENISKKGRSHSGGFPSKITGQLRRSISYRLIKQDKSALVGSKDFRAHLLEFGHGSGKERNKRPFVFKSLKEAEDEIIRIMSKKYF